MLIGFLFVITLLFYPYSHSIEKITVQGEKVFARLHSTSPLPGEKDFYQSLWKESNVSLIGGSNRPRFIRVRGFGDLEQFEKFSTSSIGFFINGIDLSEEVAIISNYQNQAVLVDKSGDSLSKGSKAYGGLFLIENKQMESLSDYMSISVGNNRDLQAQTQKVWETGSSQILTQFTATRSDGFHRNVFLDRKTTQRKEMSGHIQLTHDLESLFLSQSHLFSVADNGYDHWSLTNGLNTETDRPGKDAYQVHGHSFTLDYRKKALTLSSETSYTEAHHDESYDEDWGNNPKWNSTPGWNQNYDYYSEFQRQRRKWHQTFLIENSWSQWGFHSYGHKEKQKNFSYKNNQLRRSFQPEVDSLNLALFSRINFAPLIFGFRLEEQNLTYQEIKKISQQIAVDIGWEQHLSSQSQISLHLKQNFRAGGINTSPLLPTNQTFFDPETSRLINIDFQHQSKKWLHQQSFFYSRRTKQQVQSSTQISPSDPSSFVLFTENSGKSEAYGTELDGLVYLHPFFSLSYNMGYLQARYLDYTSSGLNLSGRHIPHSPEYSFHLRGLVTMSPHWLFTASFLQRAGFFFSNNHNQKEDIAKITNLSLQYDKGSWDIQLYINNLFNQKPKIRAYLFQLEPPLFPERLYSQLGMLQNYGVRMTYRF